MKILTLTSLYPNAEQTRHGIFVENRMVNFKHKYPDVGLVVVAPVPWFPFKNSIFGKYAQYAQVPKTEQRHNIKIFHPRYLVLPKIGMSIAPILMALSLRPFFKSLIKNGHDFDVLDVHFFYPDGVAAAWLAKKLQKPLAITARGSDIHLYPKFKLPRKMICWALRHCDQEIAVCKALAEEMEKLEPNTKKVEVCRNGVDLETFKPALDRDLLREQLNMNKFTLLSVGNLIELKGHHLIIQALLDIPESDLVIIGDGPWRERLESQISALKLPTRVRFTGLLSQTELQQYYAAADLMVLASSREGWANVLLESMACGTPVAATAIWGTPEVVASKDAGLLIQQRTPENISQVVNKLIKDYPDRNLVRRYAEGF
jgi:teichuronic acid biosynthesis glycosyltransferase TuaC